MTMEKLKKYTTNTYLWIPFTFLLFTVLLYLTSINVMDNDGFFILTNGRYILKNGVPKTNPFICIDGLKIVIQQWSWSVICYKLYEIFGLNAIYILCSVILFLTFFVYLKIASVNNVLTGKFLPIAAAAFLPFFLYSSIRPTMITVCLLMLQCLVMEKYREDNNWAYLLWLIIISFLEINLHSAVWFLHFVFLLPYLVPPIRNPFLTFRKESINRKPFFLIVPIMAAVGFLNPYGLEGILYIVQSYGKELKDANINELNAPSFSNIGIVFMIVMLILFLWIAVHRKDEFDSSKFYLLCGTSIMGIMHVRNLVYFLFGALIFLIEIVRIQPVKTEINIKLNKHSMKLLSLCSVLLLCSCISGIGSNLKSSCINKPVNNDMTPVKAIEYLDKYASKDVKIYTGFNNGGYFEWNGYKCFVDARPELYFKSINKKADIFKDYTYLHSGTDASKLKKLLDKYDFDYLCVTNDTVNTYLATSTDYNMVLMEDDYTLYEKNR